MTGIPAIVRLEALAAGERAIRARYTITGPDADVDRRIGFVMGDVRVALDAAAPLIAAQAATAERERCVRFIRAEAAQVRDDTAPVSQTIAIVLDDVADEIESGDVS